MPSWPCCRRSFFQSTHELNQTQHSSKPPHPKSLVIPISLVGTALVLAVLLVLFFYWFRKSSRSRVARLHLTDLHQGSVRKLQKFTYRELKKATNRFNETQKLGKGGYGIVYRGLLKSGEEVAVKKLVLSSLQGEREFQNELSICRRLESRYIVKLLGFATHGEKVRLLVYECMQNRSLQEALLEKHTSVHLDWGRRFSIILDIARALAYLHLDCRPCIVHGDVKPSNVLLDGNFRAYLADFGLARSRAEDQKFDPASERVKSDATQNELVPEISRIMKSKSKEGVSLERKHGKPVSEERAMAGFGDHSLPSSYLGSPHSGMRCSTDMQPESEIPGSTILPLAGSHIQQPDQIYTQQIVAMAEHTHTSMQHEELMSHQAENSSSDQNKPPLWAPLKASSKDNWWWKQENSGELKVRDYVMEWMRSELSANENKKASDPEHQISSQHQTMVTDEGLKEVTNRKKERQEQQRKKKAKAMEEDLQKEVEQAKKKERAKARVAGRKGREWWKDEYFAELSKKKGSDTKGFNANGPNAKVSCRVDGGANTPVCVFRLRDSHGGEKRGRGESATETVASDDLSSTTTSMRGTVCYVAPEFGGVGVLSEASDIYSFGVLLLVIISGRRPIEIMTANNAIAGTSSTSLCSSPTVRRFERANLITWARSLAYSGNVLDLVDDRLHGAYVREQAQLCISLALLCIRRLPSARPSISFVLKALSGETALPPLPVEFSPSPPSRLSLHQSPLHAASFVSSSEDNV